MRRTDGAEPAPLSFAQEQLWLLDRLAKSTAGVRGLITETPRVPCGG